MSAAVVERVMGVTPKPSQVRVRLSDHGRQSLLRLFREMRAKRGAEIGVWRGVFSAQMCQAVPGVHLTCVDPWEVYDGYREQKSVQAHLDDAHQQAVAALAPYDCDIQRAPSVEAAESVPDGSLDFVYIDGNHRYDYVMADLEAWSPKVRSGGIVSGHDYIAKKSHTEVVRAVDTFTKARGIAPWYVLAGDKTPSFMWVAA